MSQHSGSELDQKVYARSINKESPTTSGTAGVRPKGTVGKVSTSATTVARRKRTSKKGPSTSGVRATSKRRLRTSNADEGGTTEKGSDLRSSSCVDEDSSSSKLNEKITEAVFNKGDGNMKFIKPIINIVARNNESPSTSGTNGARPDRTAENGSILNDVRIHRDSAKIVSVFFKDVDALNLGTEFFSNHDRIMCGMPGELCASEGNTVRLRIDCEKLPNMQIEQNEKKFALARKRWQQIYFEPNPNNLGFGQPCKASYKAEVFTCEADPTDEFFDHLHFKWPLNPKQQNKTDECQAGAGNNCQHNNVPNFRAEESTNTGGQGEYKRQSQRGLTDAASRHSASLTGLTLQHYLLGFAFLLLSWAFLCWAFDGIITWLIVITVLIILIVSNQYWNFMISNDFKELALKAVRHVEVSSKQHENYFTDIKAALEQICNHKDSIVQNVGVDGGTVEVDRCQIDVQPGAVGETTEVEICLDNDPSHSPDTAVKVSPILECKPSKFDAPVQVRLISCLIPKSGKHLLIKIMSKSGEADWKPFAVYTLEHGNLIEYNVPHFCWHVAVVSEEDEKNGEYHLFNDVWMHIPTGMILSLFWKDEFSLRKGSKKLEVDHKRIISLPEEVIVSIGDTVTVDIKCLRHPDMKITSVDGSTGRMEIGSEMREKNFFAILFKPHPGLENLKSTDRFEVLYRANVTDCDGQHTDGGFLVPLHVTWRLLRSIGRSADYHCPESAASLTPPTSEEPSYNIADINQLQEHVKKIQLRDEAAAAKTDYVTFGGWLCYALSPFSRAKDDYLVSGSIFASEFNEFSIAFYVDNDLVFESVLEFMASQKPSKHFKLATSAFSAKLGDTIETTMNCHDSGFSLVPPGPFSFTVKKHFLEAPEVYNTIMSSDWQTKKRVILEGEIKKNGNRIEPGSFGFADIWKPREHEGFQSPASSSQSSYAPQVVIKKLHVGGNAFVDE